MDFDLSLEQRQFDDSLRSFLADRLPIARLRAVAETGDGFDTELWQGLAELGLFGLLVPERFGGAGLQVLDAAVAAEALGYAAAPAPFLGGAMATLALMLSGTEAQQAEYLPQIASGGVRFAVAFAGLAGQTGTARASLHDARLSGGIDAVIDAGKATHVLVYLADGGAVVSSANATGVAMTMHRSVDRTRPLNGYRIQRCRGRAA